MLKPVPFANALALTTLGFSVALWILSQFAPTLFKMVYNAQFLGANVASLYTSPADALIVFSSMLILTAIAWITAYIWATLYNRLLKEKKR